MSDLPPLNDDDELPFEADDEKPKRRLILEDGELPFEVDVEKPKKRPPSRLWRKTYIPIPLLLAISGLLICSAVLLLGVSFMSGSLLCNVTSLCASMHNLVNQASVNTDTRPPLNTAFSVPLRQADGTSINATVTPIVYTQPRCDPSADYSNYLMFVSGWLSNAEIFVTNPNGTMTCRVTDNLIFETMADWSSDRKHILFVAPRDNEDSNDVYTMDFDGMNVVNISHDRFSEQRATWAPNGTKIAFNYAINQQGRFSIMDADGSNRQDVTPDTWNTFNASWSPDSTKIAINRTLGDGTHEIDAVDVNTHSATVLASGRFQDAFRWSPDSAAVYVLGFDNRSAITRIDIATGDHTAITSSDGVSDLILSPDGRQVAFMARDTIQILDVATKVVRPLPLPNLHDIRLVSWR